MGFLALEEYAAIADQLGLPAETEADLYLMPSTSALGTNIGISHSRGLNSWVSPGEVYLVYDPEVGESDLFSAY